MSNLPVGFVILRPLSAAGKAHPMHTKHSLSVRVALPTAAELHAAAESTGKPVDLHAVATLPPGDAQATTTAEDADLGTDADRRLERIRNTLGRLALLQYSAAHAEDGERRQTALQEMHGLAAPLADEIEPLIQDAEADGDESGEWDDDPLEIGDVTLERSPGRWRVYLLDTERDRIDVNRRGPAEFSHEHLRRSEAVAWLRSWARRPDGIAAVAVGPGAGPVTVRVVSLFVGGWSVYQADHAPDSDAPLVEFCEQPEAKRQSKRIARKGRCPVIITPYKVESKGGAR